jgi:tetratricopeptide (TPR) repeat protein
VDENLSFQAEIASAKPGKVLYSISPVSGSLKTIMETIRILRGRVVGALVSHFKVRYGRVADWKPPLYEAYNEFMLGIEQFGMSYSKSFQHLNRAIEIDPTFLLPRIWLANGYFNLGDNAMTEELITIINQNREQLSQFERLEVDRLSATLQGKIDKAYRYSQQALKLAPTNVIIRFIHGTCAVGVNRPGEAVEVFENTQTELLEEFLLTAWNRAWFRRLGYAYHMLGKYKKELKAVQQIRKYVPNSLFSTEAGAYAALGKIDEVKYVIENSQAQSSRLEDPGTVMLNAAVELREHGHFETSKEIANQAVRWFESTLFEKGETESFRYNLANALYIAERWDEALSIFEQLHEEFPDNISYMGYIGTIAARKGDEAKAQEVSEELRNMDIPYIRGAHTIWRARIASLLHKQEEAFKLLRDSLMQGRSYGVALLRDMDFESLRDYKPFQELLKPKG